MRTRSLIRHPGLAYVKSSGNHVPVVFWMFLCQELLGDVGSDFFLRLPHACGKMLVCASLTLRFTYS